MTPPTPDPEVCLEDHGILESGLSLTGILASRVTEGGLRPFLGSVLNVRSRKGYTGPHLTGL